MESRTVGDHLGRTLLPHLQPRLHLERQWTVTRLAIRLGEARVIFLSLPLYPPSQQDREWRRGPLGSSLIP